MEDFGAVLTVNVPKKLCVVLFVTMRERWSARSMVATCIGLLI